LTRPVTRPAPDQSNQNKSNYTPLQTPPNSAEEAEVRRRELSQSYDGAQVSPPRTPTTRKPVERSKENAPYIKSSPPVPRTRHQRSHSYSAADDHFGSAGGTNLQVRIDQYDGPDNSEPLRPRTAGHPKSFQSLEVQIPNYNLGSPRFSPNGTPFLYGTSSLNVPSTVGEMGSSHTSSSQQLDGRWLWPSIDPRALSPSLRSQTGMDTTISTAMAPQSLFRINSQQSISNSPISPVEIDPKIYDKLSFPPDSDDPTIVRYDSASGAIIAAIPARIIAEVTSASFVDYHLVSDFFLTFRLFMNARDLAAHLIARLRWAIDRGDETGKVVRVRTFVAIRHWILNYFADDFLPHLGLRKEFANSLNNLANNAQVYGNASDLNIIGELKKCWRKTCALYWDNMEIPRTGAEPGVEVDIKPGGPPGTRDGSISRPQSTILRVPPVAATPPPKLDIPVYNPGMDSFLHDVVQPRAPWNDGNQLKERMSAPLPALPRSATAYTKSSTSRTEAITDDNTVSGRHNTSSFQDPSSSKKGGKPHKRTGSFSDALRDNRYHLPLQNSIAKSTQLLMALPYAGSLVRGNLFPPTPAHVDIIAPSTPANEPASFTFNISSSSTNTISKLSEKHLTVPLKITGGPGMKKLFGSFVKTIGVKMKPNSLSLNKGKTPATSAPISRSASVRSNISTLETIAANVSKYGMRTSGDGKPTRIDLLGAGAVDAFQKAMMEEIAYTDHGQDSSAMATDETSRDGDMDTQRRDIVDGPADTPQISEKGKRSILDELESIKQRALEARSAANSAGGNSGSANFLDSASTSGASSTRGYEGSILGATSFLEDNSSPEDYGHHSPMVEQQERIPKSFSFGRVSSHFNRIMGGGDRYAISPSPTGDIRSLHSARSFSHIRSGSLLSQIGSVITMDNIAEFIESGPPTNNEGSGLGMRGRTLLRRRPGGNLKAVATIGELEQPIRPMSTGSIGTGILSLEDTRLPELQIRPRQRAMSPESQSSLASGPRAIATVSFEAGVQLLREIPDDEDDDGGLDVALMKLEGKFPRKTPIDENILFDFHSSRATSVSQKLSSKAASRLDEDEDEDEDYDDEDDYGQELRRRHQQTLSQQTGGSKPKNLSGGSLGVAGPSNPSIGAPGPPHPSANTIGLALSSGLPVPSLGAAGSAVDLAAVDSRLTSHLNSRQTNHGNRSDDGKSDLSSELSFENLPAVKMIKKQYSANTFPPIGAGTIISELGLPAHPLRHPPSPPLTVKTPKTAGTTGTARTTGKRSVSQPHAAPQSAGTGPGSGRRSGPSTSGAATAEQPRPIRQSQIFQPTAVHLPFILAYDSELLAKQFTLIEKDALLEVDWKELVELNWSQADADVKDWVELLNSRDIKGVEVVVARFNLMCRWARSSIVMTASADERARTIVKLIHIAAHARRLNNYATMYQLTIALLTADIARLRSTWELISPVEMLTFRELEALVQPVRNFHNLRVEMEKVTGETGCIPFVGLFTHDLILNAQRPLWMHFQPLQPLVNFERHRMTAGIVKKLLRLIEASHQYKFTAVDGVCERCLWISALDDDEIRGLSLGIEPPGVGERYYVGGGN
ncbi:hypothetical protein FPQ18DRAFT_251716, partial [Pyronema domesticum]